MWSQWIVGTSNVCQAQTSHQERAQETLFRAMDIMGVKLDVSRDDAGHRRHGDKERGLVGTETAVKLGWNHSTKVSLAVPEGQHICHRPMPADCVANQHDSTL